MWRAEKDARRREHNAYLTVYLALCLTIVLSLCLTLIDGVRRNGAGLQAQCVADIGMQSIMAEYHRELLSQYNLFAIDTSYGTVLCSKANTEDHLKKYLEKNLRYDDIFLSDFFYRDFFALGLEGVKLTRVSILSDYGGAVFRKCAVDAVKDDVGLGLLEELQEWMRVIEVNGLEEGAEEVKKRELDEQIAAYNGTQIEIKEGEWETIYIQNPTQELEQKRKLGILKLVTEEETLSKNAINVDNLIENRMQMGTVNHGNIELAEQTGAERLIERFFFQEYLLRYMGRYGLENEEDVLHYQIEYLIAGNESDAENLRSIANRICAIRESANAIYLLSDEVKRTEIQLVAELVSSLVLLPEIAPILEGVILLGWAYAESIYDVKSLMAGGEIPLMKDEDSWHYGLAAALEGSLQESGTGEGLSYEDYLRIFMMFEDTDTVTARAMSMVEADIRNTPGNAAFRLDGCYTEVEAYIRIASSYGYQYEMTRQKTYN